MDKIPAKIVAIVEVEFNAHTTDMDSLTAMVREKFYPTMRDKVVIKQVRIKDHGDYPQTFDQ